MESPLNFKLYQYTDQILKTELVINKILKEENEAINEIIKNQI